MTLWNSWCLEAACNAQDCTAVRNHGESWFGCEALVCPWGSWAWLGSCSRPCSNPSPDDFCSWSVSHKLSAGETQFAQLRTVGKNCSGTKSIVCFMLNLEGFWYSVVTSCFPSSAHRKWSFHRISWRSLQQEFKKLGLKLSKPKQEQVGSWVKLPGNCCWLSVGLQSSAV